jgi:predicted pyridoxine 5'-phosphate oxidase superfamily flavin-nucleotide-binding protein
MDAAAPGPWHRGEIAVQARVGVDPARREALAPLLRPFLDAQHRAFYPQLPMLVAGAVDEDGFPWATILEGGPGFLRVPDERHLRIGAAPAGDDPARPGLAAGRPVGLLGIELPTRRRNRLNGRIVAADAQALEVEVSLAFGNCPKYIHTRALAAVDDAAFAPAPAEAVDGLDAAARAAIARACTFFVASHAGAGEGGGADVSHRGGRPGFVGVEREAGADWLAVPDFAGNRFFNTLGNLVATGRAGVLLPDFESGDVLQLSGEAEVIFDGPRVAAFAGAERLWRVRAERVVRRRGALRWRGAAGEASPFVGRTGTWAETAPSPD